MNFLINKYSRWYFSIIENRKQFILKDTYYEEHHIFPTALGGPDIIENKVRLSSREHLLCHLLLTKMLEGSDRQKMIFPVVMMGKHKGRKINSRTYEKLRLEHITFLRDPIASAHMRQKMSIAARAKIVSPETKAKMSQLRKGKKHSPETRLKNAR